MANYKAAFLSYLDSVAIKYSDEDEYRVEVRYTGDNLSTIAIKVNFDEDGDDLVALRCWSVGRVKEGKLANVILACNELNNKFRWVKFYVDDDQDVTVSLDAVVDIDTVGPECKQLVVRMVNIIDEAYPTLMKAMWS